LVSIISNIYFFKILFNNNILILNFYDNKQWFIFKYSITQKIIKNINSVTRYIFIGKKDRGNTNGKEDTGRRKKVKRKRRHGK